MRLKGVPERTNKKGRNNSNVRLTEAQVQTIRRNLREGFAPSVLAHNFGVHISTIRSIRNGKLWSHLPDPGAPKQLEMQQC